MSRSSCSCIIRLLCLLPPRGCTCLYNPLHTRRWQGSFMSPTPQAIARLAALITARPSATSSASGGSPRSGCYCASPSHRYHGRLQSLFIYFFHKKNVLSFASICSASSILQSRSFLPSSLLLPLPISEEGVQTCIWADWSIGGALVLANKAKHCN